MGKRRQIEPGVVVGAFHHQTGDGRTQCDLCPRHCRMREGQHGFCLIREVRDGEVVLTSYGRASGFCIDPIEKKPLNHFYPGSSVLSFGTAGCNLGCRFCQNWSISKAREHDALSETASAEQIVSAAERAGCRSIAFTYNDPVIFAEYVIDCAELARARGVKTVAVTAGYITEQARPLFFEHIDAVNVNLKAFSPDFYRKQCFAKLEPVQETLVWLKQNTDIWLEVTTLLIPGLNDGEAEVEAMSAWCVANLGAETPLHFTAFHPDFKLRDVPATPLSTLVRAREQALSAGLKHVYLGNVHTAAGQSTACAACGNEVIERVGYRIGRYQLNAEGLCIHCGHALAGRLSDGAEHWGPNRRRLYLSQGQMA